MDFTLRPWAVNDLDSLVLYANNYKIAKFLSDGFPHPFTIEHGKNFIEAVTHDNPNLIFAIDVNGKAVGSIGVHPQSGAHQKNAELGYWLAEPFWGHGIMTKAIIDITDMAFNKYDINRIFARPYGTNKASHRILEKADFTLEARFVKTIYKNGEYLDELIYSIRRDKT